MQNNLTYNQLKALNLFMSTDSSRHVLQNIKIRKDLQIAVATNGKILIWINGEFEFDTCIPSGVVNLILKNQKKKKGNDNVAFFKTEQKVHVELFDFSIGYDEKEVQYPLIERVLVDIELDSEPKEIFFDTELEYVCASALHLLGHVVNNRGQKTWTYKTGKNGGIAFHINKEMGIVIMPTTVNSCRFDFKNQQELAALIPGIRNQKVEKEEYDGRMPV